MAKARKKKAPKTEPVDSLPLIEPDLRPLARPCDAVKFDSRQTNTHDRRSIDEIKASLADHGQKKPIYVLRSTMEVKAGNGTLQAAKELGWTHIAMVISDDPEDDARRYAIRDNRTHQFSAFDVDAVTSEITDLNISPDDIGWNDDEWKIFIEPPIDLSSESQVNSSPDDFPEVDESLSTDYCCPKCGYRWSGKAGE